MKGLDTMEIRTFGEGERLLACRRVLLETAETADFSVSRLFLLPIPSTRDRKTITGTNLSLDEAFDGIGQGDAVAGYAIPENIKAELVERGAIVYDCAEDENFLLRNAEVTARGALGYILTNFKKDITDLRVGIVGYGRIGTCLLHYLLFLGAPVTLYTTRESVAMELSAAGVNASSAFEGISELDLLVNTAPAALLKGGEVRSLLSRGVILDLASGNVFADIADVVKLPSVPERFYPLSAGKIYAQHIAMRLLGGAVC